MPELSENDLLVVRPILNRVREELASAAGGDRILLHSMRRYIAKRLEFDERGTPTQRRKLRDLMWKRQRGICAVCPQPLPETECELDRIIAHEGYVEGNVRLVHHHCHRDAQAEKGFR